MPTPAEEKWNDKAQHAGLIFTCAIDETCEDFDERAAGAAAKAVAIVAGTSDSLAREVLYAREMLTVSMYPMMVRGLLGDVISLLAYAVEHPARRKRVPMDVDEMVKQWAPLVKKLAIAHDVDEKDLASSQLDDFLKPVVAAPVKEIREFYRKLTANLKADKTVPWAVWKLFDYWGENVLDKISKEETEGLKKDLALKIVELTYEKIPKEDWIEAMLGALQWRSQKRLQEIQKSVESGAQPRVRGKESCLFLTAGEATLML